jgi:plasmid stability protein
MSVAVTVRDLPEEVRDELAARARRDGKSLQEFLKGMLIQSASRPTPDEVIARARTRVEATGVTLDADEILAARDVDRR